MEENIKVSVIVPIYNAGLYLERCLDSMAAQTMQEKEIICVNDGSVDNSEEILKKYSERYSFITYHTQKNQGAGVARNNGMNYAKGEYVAFWDADDIFEPTALEVLYTAAKEERADVAVCGYQTENVESGIVAKVEIELFKNREIEQHFFAINNTDICFDIFQIFKGWPWDKLYRREFIIEKGLQFQALRTSNDGLFVYSAVLSAAKIALVRDILMTHRIGDGKSLENTRDKSWGCAYEMLVALDGWMKKTGCYDTYKQSFLNFVLQFLVWNLDTLVTWDSYQNFFEAIKNKYSKRFGLEGHDETYFYDNKDYKKYKVIVENSSIQYLLMLKDEMRKQNVFLSEVIKQKQWKVPYDKIERGCNLALYGAGEAGKDLYSQITQSKYCDVSLWVDQKDIKIKDSEIRISPIDVLKNGGYDCILIAISNEKIAEQVKQMLLSWNIDGDKIIKM